MGVSPLRVNNTIKFTKQDKAEILNNQFCSVFSVDDGVKPKVLGPKAKIMHNITIRTEGIVKQLKNLDP